MNGFDEMIKEIFDAKKKNVDLMLAELCSLHYKLGFAEANNNFELVEEIAIKIDELADDISKHLNSTTKTEQKSGFTDFHFTIYNEVVNEIYESADDEVDEISLDIMVNYELTDKDKEELISYFYAVRDDYNKTKMVELTWDDEFTVKLGCRKWINDTFFKNGGKKTIFETFFKNH